MDQFGILEKELLAKTKIIEYLEGGLRSYSDTVSSLINQSIKSEISVKGKKNHGLLIENKQYLALKEQFFKLEMKSKNYLKTIELLECKNNEQSQQIMKNELSNDRLKQIIRDLEGEKHLVERKLAEAIQQNEELESLKICQAKEINELYLETFNNRDNLKIVLCDLISIKSTFSSAHLKSLSIDDYESEFFKENFSFNQETSLNSSIKSGQHTNNTTIKNPNKISQQLKKEGINDGSFHQNTGIFKVFPAFESYNQQFADIFLSLESEFNFLYDKIFRLSCMVQQMIEEKKIKGLKINEIFKVKELEQEIEDYMEKEEVYESIVRELEKKLDCVLLEKRDLLASLSIEREKNLGLSQQIDSHLFDLKMNPEPILRQDSSSDQYQQEIDSIKALAETEKNYFLDHIIMIEKENSTNLIE